MRRLLLAAALVTLAAFATGVFAQPSSALDARLKKLEEELRCLVCQNQTLADSNAPLADDLRREVRELAVSGKNNDEIKAYLVARYGDFVLYKPPVKGTTWLLWFGPFVLLAGGGLIWALVLRRRSRRGYDDDDGGPPGAQAVDAGVEKARELLDQPEI
jgi:cytochrome c-type biogenesis protein CcmH